MTDDEIRDMAADNGMVAARRLPDGRYVAIAPMTYDKYRLVIGSNPHYYDDGY